MRKFELKILIVVLAVFLLLFSFIPKDRENSIFNESNSSVLANNSINIDSSGQSVIMDQIVSGNQSREIMNLSDRDKFVEDKLLEKSNDKFNEIMNSTE
jgi:hypothetical protein